MSDDTVPPFEWVSHIVRYWLECLQCELCELPLYGVPTKFVFWAFSEVPHRTGTMRQGFLFEHAGEPLRRGVLCHNRKNPRGSHLRCFSGRRSRCPSRGSSGLRSSAKADG
jgi:hypothetical protein